MTALVVGIGHPFRRDDGIGPAVAEAIGARALPGIDVLAHHGEGTDLMERWQGFARVVLVDATAAAGAPGTLRRWDGATPLPAGLFPKSSHLFGLAEAVEMARLLGRLPPALTVVGVEGEDFAAGQGFTARVAAALPDAVAMVLDALRP